MRSTMSAPVTVLTTSFPNASYWCAVETLKVASKGSRSSRVVHPDVSYSKLEWRDALGCPGACDRTSVPPSRPRIQFAVSWFQELVVVTTNGLWNEHDVSDFRTV